MAMIPAMTTGMMDFIINSGLMTDMAAMPVPVKNFLDQCLVDLKVDLYV